MANAGGGAEWTEEWNTFLEEFQRSRLYFAGKAFSPLEFAELGEWRYADPVQYLSLRLAAPAPGVPGVLSLGALAFTRRRR